MAMMNSLGATVSRILTQLIRVEECTVVKYDKKNNSGVLDRDAPGESCKYWNTVTVAPRHVKKNSAGKRIYHENCRVLQHSLVGHYYGHPWTPRVGDIVIVLFVLNQQPLVLGCVNSSQMEPVCRAPFNAKDNTVDARYDDVNKICQHEMMDFNPFEEAYNYKRGKKPTCEKWFHKSRDTIKIFECNLGNEGPCNTCQNLDNVVCSGNAGKHTFLKHFSSGVAPGSCISNEMPPWTDWYHHHCGSQYWFKDSGEIFIENGTTNSSQHGHLYFDSTGTINMHSHQINTALGSRLMLYSPESTYDDPDDNLISCEMQDLPTTSVFRIFKDGSMRITSMNSTDPDDIGSEVFLFPDGHCWLWNTVSNASVEIFANGIVTITSPSEINLNAPVIKQNGIQIHPNIMEGWIE